jgi:hypothetical protein
LFADEAAAGGALWGVARGGWHARCILASHGSLDGLYSGYEDCGVGA